MPLFNQKISPGLTVADDNDILHFLNPNEDKWIDARTALKNSDIYSIVFQLSADLANGKLKADAPRAQGILNKPTQTSNAHAFWQAMFAQLLLGGECFAYRWRNKNGTDMTWEYLRPSRVTPFLLEDGSGLIYNINFDEPEVGIMQAVPQADMIHIRLLSQNGGKTGMSSLYALSSELQIKDQSNKITLSALGRSIIAPDILPIKHGGLLSDEDKASRSRKFMKQTSDSKNGPIVLDDLETYQPLEVKNNIAQLLNQVNWTGAQIAKVYGVSDSIINGQGDQQSSLQMMGNAYVKSLSRFAKPIVSELNNKLNANVNFDLRPAIDPLGDNYATTVANLRKNGTIAANQAIWLLKEASYFPNEMPKPSEPPVPISTSKNENSPEGGDDSEQD
jgi:HK97 family phage portal protein